MAEHESDFRRQSFVQRGPSVGTTVLIVAVLVVVVIIGAVGLVGAGWWAVSHGTFGLREGPTAILRINSEPLASLFAPDAGLEGPAADHYRQELDRQMNEHVVRLRSNAVIQQTIRDPATAQTQWYDRFDDDQRRLNNFRRRAVAERVPGTSMIEMHFDGISAQDAATIANAWARSYLGLLAREQRHQLDDQAAVIQQQRKQVQQRIAALTQQHDALADRQSAQALRLRHELESQLERDTELQRRLDELQLQRQHRPPVTLEQPAAPASSPGPARTR